MTSPMTTSNKQLLEMFRMQDGRIAAYKVFNSNWTAKQGGFKYELGQSYKEDKTPILCQQGFHACLKLADCFNYYDFDSNNKVAKVILGVDTVEPKEDCSKVCSSEITIMQELSWFEVLSLCNTGRDNTGNRNTGNRNTGNWNTGDRNTGYRNTGNWNTGDRNTGNWNTGNWNTGDRNTGDRNTGDRNTGNRNTGYRNTGNWNTGYRNTGNWNTGYRNTGNWNTGDRNTGYRNTGNWNTGNWNTGYMNTVSPSETIVFNKPCTFEKWDNSYKPDFLLFNLTEWIDESKMSEQEKYIHPSCSFTGGYLKEYKYKEAFIKSFLEADKTDRMRVKDLPNFDEDVFFEISGIRISDYE